MNIVILENSILFCKSEVIFKTYAKSYAYFLACPLGSHRPQSNNHMASGLTSAPRAG